MACELCQTEEPVVIEDGETELEAKRRINKEREVTTTLTELRTHIYEHITYELNV